MNSLVKNKFVLGFGALLVTLVAFAEPGGWVGMGGEVFRFDRNPWFVKNTKTVNYCLVHDASGFSASLETSRQQLKSALSYWKREMRLSVVESQAGAGWVQIADQEFVEVSSCQDSTVDLQIILGPTGLNTEQRQFLKDPKSYVGITVRTSYDLKKMKGQGFMYIGADQGAEQYKNNGELIDKAWQYPALLEYALIHELGHVFGVPHTGTGVMSETFLNVMLNKKIAAFYVQNPEVPFLSFPQQAMACGTSGTFFAAFFNLPQSTDCLKLKSESVDGRVWSVWSRADAKAEFEMIGNLRGSPLVALDMNMKPAIFVQLPDEQTVFGVMDKLFSQFLLGPTFYHRTLDANYTLKGSLKPSPVQMQITPDSIVVSGVVDGKIKTIVSYALPTLMRYFSPVSK